MTSKYLLHLCRKYQGRIQTLVIVIQKQCTQLRYVFTLLFMRLVLTLLSYSWDVERPECIPHPQKKWKLIQLLQRI